MVGNGIGAALQLVLIIRLSEFDSKGRVDTFKT